MKPLPVNLGIMLTAKDPFLLDTVMAQIMGFGYKRIPLLNNARQFGDPQWGAFDPENVSVILDGQPILGIPNVPVLHNFIPPPGWKRHIELQKIEVLA